MFGLFSGVLADRFDNRRVLIVTQARRCSSPVGLAGLAFAGVDQVGPYFALAFLGGAALVFDAPNRHALTFQLVGRDELPNAVALNSSLFNAGRVVGPAIGGDPDRRRRRRAGASRSTRRRSSPSSPACC